jgi:ketosteroid isomerase-like protein
MSQNTDVLQGGYDAFNSGDQQALTDVFAEDVRWEGPNDKRIPGAGTFDGRDAALTALGEAVEPFESFSSQPDEFVEEGDTVVVLGHTEARTKTGNDLKVPFVHVWRLDGGKVKRGQILTDTAAVLDAIS